jgi:hypothetical protein
MPIKITCPHCEHVHRFSQPYPVPGSEVHCNCGRVLVISFPPDMMGRLESSGASFADPHAPAPDTEPRPYQPAPTPARPRLVSARPSGPRGPKGDPS